MTFHEDGLKEPLEVGKASKIFTCSMGEMFDPETESEWVERVFDTMRFAPQHTFQILTKCPENLPLNGYPSNVWLGISIDYKHRLRGLDIYLTRSLVNK